MDMEDVTACVREYIAQNDISVAQMSSDLGIEESRLRPGDGGKFSAVRAEYFYTVIRGRIVRSGYHCSRKRALRRGKTRHARGCDNADVKHVSACGKHPFGERPREAFSARPVVSADYHGAAFGRRAETAAHEKGNAVGEGFAVHTANSVCAEIFVFCSVRG